MFIPSSFPLTAYRAYGVPSERNEQAFRAFAPHLKPVALTTAEALAERFVQLRQRVVRLHATALLGGEHRGHQAGVVELLRLAERLDRIVVLDGGRIVEDGAPAELAARGGAYSALLQAEDQVRRQMDHAGATGASEAVAIDDKQLVRAGLQLRVQRAKVFVVKPADAAVPPLHQP